MLLKVSDLTVKFNTYRGSVTAVDGVSMALGSGKTLCIVGESGCGKSVTALSLLGLLPKKISTVQGTVLFDGKDLLSKGSKELQDTRGNQISMIFQEPMTSLNPVMKVGRQVEESLKVHRPHLSQKERSERVRELFEWVGIVTDHTQDFPHELSGGMRQRVMIAMALACEPRLLIADEPTTALDVTIQAQILELMMKLQQRLGMGVILITHDLGIVYDVADDVVVMYAGKIVEKTSVEKLFEEPLHPYTQGLLVSLPDVNVARSRVPGIAGTVPSLHSLPKGCYFQDRCFKVTPQCREKEPVLEMKKTDHEVSCFEVPHAR